jgi:hypothetical protein
MITKAHRQPIVRAIQPPDVAPISAPNGTPSIMIEVANARRP